MNEEKIEKLIAERKALSYERKREEQSMKYHREKAEELLIEANTHLKLVNEAGRRIVNNTKQFFDKGTELEELTGKKRIDNLR